ncbi:Fic family protein [Kutzneria buriramensis]|uniref:Fic family protein n=1 Tax=Kutzneria buriramensis TaxID=1045776 RepID=A0A3E0IA31_9PSEU|nr:Fic family protein [Kutzneria buriramensis]REH55594.1 Fic family protein [Kutzneria buriramensis]
MRVEAFADRQRDHVVRSDRGYPAFVPPKLPPEVDFDVAMVRRLSAADRAVGQLAGVGRTLPNPYLLAQAMVRREAVLSSRIEGTVATLSDLVRYEVAPAAASAGDVAEVYNYVAAVEHVLAPDRRLPLSLPLLREAHGILLSGVRGGYATPGDFRRTQNWIGPPGCVLDTATYVPPPPEHMWECLDAFEKHLHAEHELPPLITIACLHYQFEAIHPFIEGNGRVGRLLVALLLVEWGLLPAPLLDLSAYLEPRRDEYYERLLAVTVDGDWTGWLSFFLDVVAHQAADALHRAQALQSLREELRGRVTNVRSSSLAPRLVDALFETPAMTINRAAEVLGVTHRGAMLNVQRLVEANVLTEVASTARARLFLADDVLRLLGED